MDRQLLLVLVNVALYAACYQMQVPVQPYVVKSLSADSVASYAALKSWNGLLQLVGSLLVGRWVDASGPRPVLVASFAASALNYAMTYVATTSADGGAGMWWLMAAQVPTVLQHAVLAARGYVALSTPDDRRTQTLGYISVAYGVGFIVGPVLGGQLATHVSLQASAAAATAGSLLSLASLLLLLDNGGSKAAAAAAASGKESPKPTTAAPAPAAPADGSSASSGVLAVWTGPLGGLLTVKAVASGSLALFHSTFTLVAAERFGLDAGGVGFLMSFVGALGIFAQAVLVAPLLAVASEDAVSSASAALLTASFAALGAASTPAQLYAVVVPLTIFSTLWMLLNTAQITRAAPAHLKGSLVAVDMALGSGSRMVAPAVGAHLLRAHGYYATAAAMAALMALATLLLQAGVGGSGGSAAVKPPAAPAASLSEEDQRAVDAAIAELQAPPVSSRTRARRQPA
jgi:MFS transporter, DHA1 family, tetracycline resistance protein